MQSLIPILESQITRDKAGTYPAYYELPPEYRSSHDKTPGRKLFSNWFYSGVRREDIPDAKEGVNKAEALQIIRTIMRSWSPSHEYKAGLCGYLFDQWFKMEQYKPESKT
jgi:hypothetical protein